MKLLMVEEEEAHLPKRQAVKDMKLLVYSSRFVDIMILSSNCCKRLSYSGRLLQSVVGDWRRRADS